MAEDWCLPCRIEKWRHQKKQRKPTKNILWEKAVDQSEVNFWTGTAWHRYAFWPSQTIGSDICDVLIPEPQETVWWVSQWWNLSFSGDWSKIIHLGYVGSSKPALKFCETLSRCAEWKGGRALCRDNSVVDWGPEISPQCWERKTWQGAHNRCAFSARTRNSHYALFGRTFVHV